MDAPTDLDALAEALRVDGVVVDRVMGSGEAQEAHDRIAQLVRETPFPVYVALVQQPDGLPDDAIESTEVLAGLLNRRLGDGLYVLQTSESIQQVYAFGLGTEPARLSLGAHSNNDLFDEAMQDVGGHPYGTDGYVTVPAVAKAEAQARAAEELVEMGGDSTSGDYPATLTRADADDLAEHALEVQAAAQWRPSVGDYVEVRTASRGFSALVGGLVALVIALLLGQTLRGWPRNGRPRSGEAAVKRSAVTAAAAPPPDLEVERARASRLADVLAKNLERTDWDTVQDRELAGRALSARDAAEPLLTSDDVADLVGARVLTQIGAADLGRGRRGSGPPFVPCYFDPRHKPGTSTASWRLGDGQVEVPCCATCAKAVARGETPQHLRLAARRGTEPYWERDDVWARTGFGAVSDDLARDVLADRAGRR
ncbi:hypothetical protein SAMN04489844_0343 [Nocardioides exalbidus]|uniref:Uncharacterized protein n=1 Tax=Nocardioides exalbidus TaxID=402596 RepID=A0A1H4JYH8_9ACTN|nr:hypothetical protein [Nocardioides exalbidus]SEB50915.1 hypothetical protein SAMN04489844_0343 [Nocardioides exalbidus]